MYKWIFALLFSTAFCDEISDNDQEESTLEEILDFQEIRIEPVFKSNSQIWMPLAPPKPSRFKTKIETFEKFSPPKANAEPKAGHQHVPERTSGFSITWDWK